MCGGGGVAGGEWLIRQLEHDPPPTTAKLWVGTSAGAAVAALAAGVGVGSDVWQEVTGHLLSSVDRKVWGYGEAVEQTAETLDRVLGRWPQGLVVATVEVAGVKPRRVFLDATSGVSVGEAVRRSAALVPFVRPRFDSGRMWLDGGVWSSTSADRLCGEVGGGDTVRILAPLAGDCPWWGWGVGRFARVQLAREMCALRKSGAEVDVRVPCGEEARQVWAVWA